MERDRKKEIDKIVESLDVGGWSFSDEREFVENLYVGRFNCFLKLGTVTNGMKISDKSL